MMALDLDRAAQRDQAQITQAQNDAQATLIIDRRGSSRLSTKNLGSPWELGYARVTGAVRVFTPCANRDRSALQTEDAKALFRIQVQMPQWLRASLFDYVVHQSCSGWMTTFDISRCHISSPVIDLFWNAMRKDDIAQVQKLLQDRKMGPRDFLMRGSKVFSLCSVR